MAGVAHQSVSHQLQNTFNLVGLVLKGLREAINHVDWSLR